MLIKFPYYGFVGSPWVFSDLSYWPDRNVYKAKLNCLIEVEQRRKNECLSNNGKERTK